MTQIQTRPVAKTQTQTVRVFLVDDEALMRESLGLMFELEDGFELVGEAARAEDAIEMLDSLEADIVLMDIRMPGMGGIEAVAVLKERRPEAPVVMLTSHGDECLHDALDAGASGYMLKSCSRQQLVTAMNDALQGNLAIDLSMIGGLVRELSHLRKTKRETRFTVRQIEILRQVAGGKRYVEVARALSVSLSTVHRDIQSIFRELQVRSIPQAVSEALNMGIL